MTATSMLRHSIKSLLRRAGFDLVRHDTRALSDFAPEDLRIIEEVREYTRTGPERLHALIQATKYLVQADIPGAIVECGVWRGGSMMATAKTLVGLGAADRELYLLDTFEGMPAPSSADIDWTGLPAETRMAGESPEASGSVWCYAGIEDVREAMHTTGYPPSLVHLVKGRVEETIPRAAPTTIGLLRLDTDWYESTRHELEHLYPRLVSGGVLILDDYGHWQGARRAWDEFALAHRPRILLNRVDYSARIGVKP